MGEKSIIIIGAGIAGLAAAAYARMNGYQVRIFEQSGAPGGLCAAWKRGGYTFDGCIHWLVGSRPPHGFHRVWQELGALDGRPVVDHEIYATYEDGAGRALNFYTDANRLGDHLRALSPADSELIDEFIGAVRRFTQFNFSFEKQNLFTSLAFGVKMLTLAPLFQTWGSVTLREFASRFKDPLLRDAFQNVFGYPEFPAIALLMTFSTMHLKCAGFPTGGSLAFSRAIERRSLDLGAKIDYRSPVKKVVVEDGRARGVVLADGSEHRADYVVSAADGHATIFDMLEGRFVSPEVERYYRELPIFEAIIQVSLGVNRDMRNEPHAVTYKLSKPISIAGREHELFGYTHYAFDPTLAPEGKSVIECLIPSDIEYWEKLMASGRAAYDAAKAAVLKTVIAELEQRFPGLGAQVETSDVATPLTFKRYTGNWRGSMEGWRLTKETMRFMMNGMDMTLPGLKNFYMIGQWVKPGGGLPPAAQSGREVVAALCGRDRKKFRTFLA